MAPTGAAADAYSVGWAPVEPSVAVGGLCPVITVPKLVCVRAGGGWAWHGELWSSIEASYAHSFVGLSNVLFSGLAYQYSGVDFYVCVYSQAFVI